MAKSKKHSARKNNHLKMKKIQKNIDFKKIRNVSFSHLTFGKFPLAVAHIGPSMQDYFETYVETYV